MNKLPLIIFLTLTTGLSVAQNRAYQEPRAANIQLNGTLPYSLQNSLPRNDEITQLSPDILLNRAIFKTVQHLRSTGPEDLNKIMQYLNQEIAPMFDFHRMTRLSLGGISRNLSEPQFAFMVNRIKSSFLEALANRLVSYSFTNRDLEFMTPRKSLFKQEMSVKVFIKNPRGFPGRITFKFHRTNSGWKIFDVSASGQSAISHYRRKLKSIVFQRGIEGLFN